MTDNFQLYRQFIEACGGLPDTNEKGIETPTVKKNHLTLLYENLDCIWSRRAKRVIPESE